jgi:SpoVK/Ycf46/Vps4 family AAA+-type ATPase
MTGRDLIEELELLIRSRYGLILLETVEDSRAEILLGRLSRRMDIPLFVWTPSKGLKRTDLDTPVYGTNNPSMALSHVSLSSCRAIYYFQDFGQFLQDINVSSKLTDAVKKQEDIGGTLVITGRNVEVSDSIKPHSAYVKLPLPDKKEYRELVKNLYNDLKKKMYVNLEMTPVDIDRLIHNLQGLTLLEAKKILTKAIVEDGKLSPEDIQAVIDAKKAIIEKEGLLEYYPVKERIVDIADLKGLKIWLRKRSHFITQPDKAIKAGLTFPKGILLLGVPGTGKSLCAKAIAMEWKLPLLKMDPANLYSKYIGETEKKFKKAMEIAEKMAPLVLWVDEIEKAFASGGDEDGGVSLRVLGTFLSWMQDRQGDVFVVATANDVIKLPPELLRKGRFDEIFFIDLPDQETRAAIFRIHLNRRRYNADQFDLERLAEATEGFSGAEIEQVVNSALYTSFSETVQLTTELLLEEVSRTCCLAKTRAEHIQALRNWAEGRTVKAD